MSGQYVVLSRKYRPKDLRDLIGQDVLAQSLKNSLDKKAVPHAFLFYGIRGVGKTTTARILARCLSCVGPDGQINTTSSPCGVCQSCKAIDKDQHLDIMEFDAASRTSVDDIREIIDSSQYMPILGRYKIYIIDEVHMLSKSAFNALLKTLEEPPQHVKFIFATTELNKVPETISSRCMSFRLKPISMEVVSQYLVHIAKTEGVALQNEAADIMAKESEGSLRDALSMLEQAMMLDSSKHEILKETIVHMLGGASFEEISALWNEIFSGNPDKTLSVCEKLILNGNDPISIYKHMQTHLYKIIYEKTSKKDLQTPKSLSNLLYIWQILLNQAKNFQNSSYPDIVLKVMVIILAQTAAFPDIERLIIKNDSTIELSKQQAEIKSSVEDIIGRKIEIKDDQSNRVLSNVLEKFPGSIAMDLE